MSTFNVKSDIKVNLNFFVKITTHVNKILTKISKCINKNV